MGNNLKSLSKKDILIKASLFSISLFFSLLVLEFSLRFVGAYTQEEQNNKILSDYETDTNYEIYSTEQVRETTSKDKIICIGDSFTNGGNLKRDWSANYPYFLSKKLNQTNYRPELFNMGLCEDTTYGVYNRLKEYMENSKSQNDIPRYIVILTGSADTFHIKSEEEYERLKWINPEEKISMIKKSWFYKLRIYKMYRYIKFSLHHYYLLYFTKNTHKDLEWVHASFYEKLIRENKYKEASELVSNSLEVIDKSIEEKDRLSHRVFDFRDMTEPIIIAVVNASLEQNKYDVAFRELLKISDRLPEVWGLHGMGYLSYQTFRKQNIYSAKDVLTRIELGMKKNSHPNFQKMLNLFRSINKREADIDKIRLELWDKIYTLSRKYKFQIIVQNYPSDYQSANHILKHVAQKYNLPFVDNRSVFKQLIAKEGREKYLAGDDHCTPLGYETMAKNVLATLLEFRKNN